MFQPAEVPSEVLLGKIVGKLGEHWVCSMRAASMLTWDIGLSERDCANALTEGLGGG